MKRFALILVALLFITGCGISQQVYDDKVEEAEACENDLATENAKVGTLMDDIDTVMELNTSTNLKLDACEEGSLRKDGLIIKAKADGLAEGEATGRAALEGELAEAKAALEGELAEARATAAQAEADATAAEKRMEELRVSLQKELEAKTVELQQKKNEVTLRVLDTIMFAEASVKILPGGIAILDKVAKSIKSSDETIRVEGHTDDLPVGPSFREFWVSNWELSAARAASVVRLFQWRHGIDPTRMEAVGHAFYKPVAPNDTDENKERNRRVEIILANGK